MPLHYSLCLEIPISVLQNSNNGPAEQRFKSRDKICANDIYLFDSLLLLATYYNSINERSTLRLQYRHIVATPQHIN
jgi:hypothetical protein